MTSANILFVQGMTSKKINGLFDDIDQIAFNTHPPPPKDDIWKND